MEIQGQELEKVQVEVRIPFDLSREDISSLLNKELGDRIRISVLRLPDHDQIVRFVSDREHHLEIKLREALMHAMHDYRNGLHSLYHTVNDAMHDYVQTLPTPEETSQLRAIEGMLEARRQKELEPWLLVEDAANPARSRGSAGMMGSVVEVMRHATTYAIDVVFKSPVGTALLGASAKQIVDSIVGWAKAKRKECHKDNELIEVRLFGPDGKLIEHRKID
jgi:hypothetical protein